MNNIILDFLEEYNSLDELCKQILSNEKGISAYINEMNKEQNNHSSIACWENDYRQLKKMRGIRNRLVHESNSFQDNLVTIEDIKWLHTFYSRIINCTDPFSLLYKSRNITSKKSTLKENSSDNYFKPTMPSNNSNIMISIIFIIVMFVIILFFILLL